MASEPSRAQGTVTPHDYYADAAAMVAAERLGIQSISIAHQISATGEQFNAAIWAAVRLNEITERNRYG